MILRGVENFWISSEHWNSEAFHWVENGNKEVIFDTFLWFLSVTPAPLPTKYLIYFACQLSDDYGIKIF